MTDIEIAALTMKVLSAEVIELEYFDPIYDSDRESIAWGLTNEERWEARDQLLEASDALADRVKAEIGDQGLNELWHRVQDWLETEPE